MKDKIKDIFKIKFIQDVGSLQISAVIIEAITVAASLVIANSLKPALFGVYSLAVSIYSLMWALGNLGVRQTALVKLASAYTTRDRDEILSVLAYYFKAFSLITISVMIIGYFLAPYLSGLLYGQGDIGMLSRTLFLALPFVILYKLVSVIFEGIGSMKRAAVMESASMVIQSVVLAVLAALGLSLAVLMYGWILSAAISSALGIFAYKMSGMVRKGMPSLSEIVKKSCLADSRRFLRFNISMGLSENLINLNNNLPVILLGIFVLPGEVGYFKLGYGVIGVISGLFLEPIGRNIMIKLRQLRASGDIKKLSEAFHRVSLYTGAIAVVLTALSAVAYRLLIYFFLKDYYPSIRIVYILAVYFCIAGFGIGLSPVLRALERLDIEIKINALGVLIFTILAICLTKSLGISGMAAALAISAFFVKSIMYLLVRKELNKLVV